MGNAVLAELKVRSVSRAEVEDFLFHEADLLDRWALDEWAQLFTDDGEYLIPPTDLPDGDPGKHLFLVYDDRHRLGERAKRLGKKRDRKSTRLNSSHQ